VREVRISVRADGWKMGDGNKETRRLAMDFGEIFEIQSQKTFAT
jgi:hypothetical protein